MKKLSFILLSCVLGFGSIAQADTLQHAYLARLSKKDHRNSDGAALESAAAIIRQDRANFHKYGRQDDEDEDDNFFNSAENREMLEKMLERGSSTKSALRSIVNGTPLIRVSIFENEQTGRISVRVTVMEE